MAVIPILTYVISISIMLSVASFVFSDRNTELDLTPALFDKKGEYPNTLVLDDSIPVPALGALSATLNVISTNKSPLIAPPFKSKLTNPIHLVCATPSQVKEMANNLHTHYTGTEPLNVLWSDKGVWSSKFNFNPESNYNLYKPFEYKESVSYFWGISGDKDKNKLLMAGTTLECNKSALEKSTIKNDDILRRDSSDILPIEEVSPELRSMRVGYVSELGWVRVATPVLSSYNTEVVYRVGAYVVNQMSSFKKYNVQPETLHFENMLEVSSKSGAFFDFKMQDAIMGSADQHAKVYIPVIKSMLDKMDMPPHEAYTDFKTLNLKPKPRAVESIEPTALKGYADMNAVMAAKIKQLEEDVKRLEREKTAVLSTPVPTTIKVPVAEPVVPLSKVKVDEGVLAKNISGN